MEVESTHVHVLADGRKLIDVTMRRQADAPTKQPALVVPQFDDESSSSDDSDSERHGAPVYHSPVARKRDDEHDNNNNSSCSAAVLPPSAAPTETFQGDFQWENADVSTIQQLTNANAQLASQATEYKRQIKTLQIQLEALAPVPGLSAEAVQDLLLDRDDGVEHDLRDAKIVHQAKTVRHLKRTLQREKQLALDAVRQCKAMEAAKTQLEHEVETLKLKAARLQARATAASAAAANVQLPSGDGAPSSSSLERLSSSGAPSTPAASASSSDSASTVSALKKKLDDLKAKHDKVQLDCKKLQRALQREVGDDISLEEILDGSGADGGKRGRAQQIVVLKAKVAKLQAELAMAASGPGDASPRAGSLLPMSTADARVQHELAAQQAQKQRLLDKLTLERDELQTKLTAVTKTHDAVRSRVQTLEKERAESRTKVQVLVDKSQNDDALIDALQTQLATWKAKVQEVKRARTAESAGQKDDRSMAAELERLRSLVAEYKQQHQRQPSAGALPTAIGMPAPSEAAQYRAMAAEKERLQEAVKALQTQLDDKDRQLRLAKQPQQPPLPSMLPALSSDASSQSFVSRIPRKPGMPALGQQQQQQTRSDTVSASEVDAMRRTFRESLKAKDDAIAALTSRLEELQQSSRSSLAQVPASDQTREIEDLHEENAFLRQEFDRLKTRYEALVQSAKAASSATRSSASKAT